jgi:hypothetical protein
MCGVLASLYIGSGVCWWGWLFLACFGFGLPCLGARDPWLAGLTTWMTIHCAGYVAQQFGSPG